MAEYRLLGPVELRVDGHGVDAGQPRQRTVLAALLVDAGRVVTWETLVERVWGDGAPTDPRASLRAHVARIRRTLERAGDRPARLSHRSGGYVLEVDREQVDLHRFRRLAERAARAEGPDRASLFHAAVGLWRGTPLGGLDGPWVDRMRQIWTRERLDAVVGWADAELAVGNPARVVGPVAELAGEHPLAESVIAVLMRALHAVGRPADALDHYARLRGQLSDELGVEPAPETQAVFQAILRGQPLSSAAAPSSPVAVAAPPSGPRGPAQLPADLPGFVGRAAHLRRLDALLPAGPAPGPTVVAVIAGSPAVGKTTLAVHWAHRVVDRFPDGQLYLNLRGFGPDDRAMDPAEAVRRFLDALGVPTGRIPADLDAQAALYRSVLAGRRVLVVLDNARDADQVRPLLPGAPGCLVLVTSRNQLTSLLVTGGAHAVPVDVLSATEARQLLAARLGAARVAAEPAAVDALVTRCAHLPLALAVVAARAATAPGSLEALADELRGGSLDVFDGGDAVTHVRAVFSWSYRSLPADRARLFRLLGVHPAADTSTSAAASLVGAPPATVRPVLGDLVRAHLLVEHLPGRYTCHDLLRAYAAELAHAVDDDTRHRLLDHYLHSAYAAARQLDATRDPLDLAPPVPGVTVDRPATYAQALDWLAAERGALLAAVGLAVAAGFDTHVWQLAWTLYDFLDRQGRWRDLVAVQRAAVVATRRLGEPTARARAHRNLANAYTRLGRFDEAYTELEDALALAGLAGDPVAQAHTHLNLTYLQVKAGRHAEALAHARQARALYEGAGHRLGMAEALSKAGWCHVLLGEDRRGAADCERALAVFQDLDDTLGVANTLSTLGVAHQHLGDAPRAVACHERARELYRGLGDRYEEAATLVNLGDTHHGTGDTDAAHEAWRQALVILADLGHPDAELVRAKRHGAPSGSVGR